MNIGPFTLGVSPYNLFSPYCSWTWTSIWLFGTIKGQVFAHYVLFQRVSLAVPSAIPRNLNLFLSLLQKPLLEPIRYFSPTFIHKVIVTITSTRQVSKLVGLSYKKSFLFLHRDKVVLRPRTSFLPIVVSAFCLDVGLGCATLSLRYCFF